jgi:cellobiose transport system substrate-binding protein
VTVRKSRRTTAIAITGLAIIGLVATGCSASGTPSSSDDKSPVTLTVTTFGTMGLDKLYAKYEALHPNVTIKATNIDTGDNARTDAFTKIAAGSGLPDVQSVEEGWLGAIMQVSDQFTDLKQYGADKIKDRWVDWKLAQGTDAKGRIIGYGTDIGPEGLCYNSKLFGAAGLPTDRAAVATLFGGKDATWDKFFEVAKQYKAKTGKSFYDQSGFVWNAMVNQLPEGYYTKDGKLNIDGNTQLQTLWGQLADGAASGLSDNQAQWDWGGGKAFTDGSFATFVCPGWMLGVLKGSAEKAKATAATGWDFADVFPGGAANWGGTFLTVPTQSKHPKEAAALATWLTEAKQEAAAFQAAGTFPSVKAAQTDAAVTGASDLSAFFNNAPLGTILGSRAVGVVAQYKGPDDSVIQSQVFGPVVKDLDAKKLSGDAAWAKALKLLNQLVVNK